MKSLANELRMGNLIEELLNEEPEMWGIKVVTPFVIDCISRDGYGYRPIPLTDEILSNGGAKKINASMFRMGAMTFQNSYTSSGTELTEKILSSRRCCRVCYSGKFLCNLEFTHQWQNLHFILSGKDLEFKYLPK